MLSIQQRRAVNAIKDNAKDGNVTKFIDSIDTFLSKQHLDLPTVIDADASIINKFAVIDIAKEDPNNAIAKYTKIMSQKPEVNFWFKSDNHLVPLTLKVMTKIIQKTIHYLGTHYDNADDDDNQNVIDKIGELKS